MSDTIYALSSGSPPAAIAVIRISGPQAGEAILALVGLVPVPRTATLRRLRDARGDTLDHALVLWFPGSNTATGEDLAELHLHGGRAVVTAVEQALSALPGLRHATPGEFTRRAFANGRIDLAEAEGLADLLSAETELQRRQALSLASGAFSCLINDWREAVFMASAKVEAVLDFGDEDDVEQVPPDLPRTMLNLAEAIDEKLRAPRAETLREGFRVVLAGPPNSGKSSLFNLLVEADAAITAPIAGTTRDVLTRPVALEGVPFVFADTAGLRDETSDPIELAGIGRARSELEKADLVLWLGVQGEGSGRMIWEIESFADQGKPGSKDNARHRLSAVSGVGLAELRRDLVETASSAMPLPGSIALNRRQHDLLNGAYRALADGGAATDLLIIAEALRVARSAFDRLLGHAATEDMLDALFGRFCIGK